jgi:hypothetical protein
MSALNVLQMSDAIHFFSDTSALDADGKVAGFASKIVAIPTARAAIACCGPSFISEQLLNALRDMRSLSELVQESQAYTRVITRHMQNDQEFVAAGSLQKGFSVFVGGFSESGERNCGEWKAWFQISIRLSNSVPRIGGCFCPWAGPPPPPIKKRRPLIARGG